MNPQSLNGYTYVLNNSMSFTDPTGLVCEPDMPHANCGSESQPHGGGFFGYNESELFVLGFTPTGFEMVPDSSYYCITAGDCGPATLEPVYGNVGLLGMTATVFDGPGNLQPPGTSQLSTRAQKCLNKVQSAAESAMGRPVVSEGPTQGQGLDRSGYRNGAYNFNFFVPGYAPGRSLCGRYSPPGILGTLTGIGPSLHIVYPPGFCNPTGDPTVYQVGPTQYGYGFLFTAHIDSAFAFNPIGFFWHLIRDVLGKSNHGC